MSAVATFALIAILVGAPRPTPAPVDRLGTDLNAGTTDCNSNGLDDACDISCGTTGGPCDVASCGLATDCNTNGLPDACDLAGQTSADCNTNGQPDECDIANAAACRFPDRLSDNTTGQPEAIFIGPPDDVFVGLGGQVVTYAFDCGLIIDGPGPDFTVYEVDGGGAEFSSIDVLVSVDGSDFTSVKFTEQTAVNIPGDEVHGSNSFARSYDLAWAGLRAVRYVRLDGNGTGSAGGSSGFDLDAIGAVHLLAGGDCDASGTLDACDVAADPGLDCDTSGLIDACEIAAGATPDCNSNGVPDVCDLAGQTSADCNANQVLDTCELRDCNSNGVVDTCDITAGTSVDCNSNGTPDACEQGPGMVLFQPQRMIPLGTGHSASFTIPAPFAAAGPVTFEVTALGDLNLASESIALSLNGVALGNLFQVGGLDCLEITDQIVISAEAFNTIVADQDVVVDLVPSGAVAPVGCPVATFMQLTVAYERIADCNSNGQIDFCDIVAGTSADLNGTGLPDECDPDCNGNSVADDIDIAAGTSIDCNDNDRPDECDLAAGTSADCNADGRPDECPVCSTVEVVFIMDTSTSMNDEAAALCATITEVAAALQADLVSVDVALLGINNNPGGAFSCLTDNVVNVYGTVVPGSPPINNEILGACPGGVQVAQEDWGRATSVVAGQNAWLPQSVRVIIPISDEGPWCGDPVSIPGVDRDSITHAILIAQQNRVIVSPITGTGSPGSMIALAQELADATGGRQFSSSLPAEDLALAIEEIVLDACATDSDCNANGDPDDCELAAGTSADCDGNLRPDECDPDCNTNGSPDACDLVAGTSDDCDVNSVPDECDPDCNANGVPDACDLAGATSGDCNDNGVPDECDLAAGTSNDCNSNALPDACDIAGMTSDDCNGNGRPDTCDLAPGQFTTDFETTGPFGTTAPQSFTLPAALAAAGEVSLSLTAVGDLENANEWVTVDINGAVLGTVFETGGAFCAAAMQSLVVTAEDFNNAVAGGDAVITLTPTATVNTNDCGGITYVTLQVIYEPLSDCNANAILDPCDIAVGTSIDLDVNGQPDECQPDCNANDLPDKFEVIQGTSPDCNANVVPDACDIAAATSNDCNTNGVPDECDDDCNNNRLDDACDIAGGTSDDCNASGVPDECEPDCDASGVPDDCEIEAGTTPDCNTNGVPDSCDVNVTIEVCRFPSALVENTTGFDDAIFTGPPDDVFRGLGGQIVTYAFDCGPVVDGPGADLTVYEVDTGSPEFGNMDVLVSLDGASFVSIKTTETAAVNIPGDEAHGSNSYARSYDLAGSSFSAVRFVRIDGSGTGSAGSSTGFDLDALGAVHVLDRDCNHNQVPDVCDLASAASSDCNANTVPDECNDIPAGDCQCDGLVDLSDFGAFDGCVTGPRPLTALPDSCRCLDFDADNDVDLADFVVMQSLLGGA